MQQGFGLRNSLIVATLAFSTPALGSVLALVLPLVQWTRGAEAAEGSTGQAVALDRSAGSSAGKSGAALQATGDPAASGPSEQNETADSREISLLVRQLGDPTYSVRQRATKRLIELGIVTKPFLIQARDADDAEVRSRAGQVLAQVVEADFQLQLEAFANDLEGRQQHTLPCWRRFSQVFGQEKVSRMLFVEMQKAEPALLEALDTNPKLAGELFATRMQSIVPSFQLQLRDGQPTISAGSICSLLLVSAADGVTVSDPDASQLCILIQQPAFQRNLITQVDSGILKKMLGAWIVRNGSPALAHQNFNLAFAFDLNGGLDLALKMLSNDSGGQPPAMIRHAALMTIGRFGNHEHIAAVEPLLKDTDPCLSQQPPDGRQPQIRDAALAVLIHLSGQELKDYGLDHILLNFQTLPPPGTVAFADALTRKAALRKWEQWAGRVGAGPAENHGAGQDASNQPAGDKPTASPAYVPGAPGTTTPAPTTPPAERPGAPAAKAGQQAAPRPAELEP